MYCVIFRQYLRIFWERHSKIFINVKRNVTIKSILGLKLLSSSVIQQHELAVNTNNVVKRNVAMKLLLL